MALGPYQFISPALASEKQADRRRLILESVNPAEKHREEKQGGEPFYTFEFMARGWSPATWTGRRNIRSEYCVISNIVSFPRTTIDGHAINLSVFLESNSSYLIVPLYDVMSAYSLVSPKDIPPERPKW